jgi:hypothetical protein
MDTLQAYEILRRGGLDDAQAKAIVEVVVGFLRDRDALEANLAAIKADLAEIKAKLQYTYRA